MVMNKASAKAFLKTFNTFTVLKDMVKKAVDPEKPMLIKTHPKNRKKLDDFFLGLSYDWGLFKADLGLSDVDFNAEEDGVPMIRFNDAWMEALKDEYYELIEKSEEKLKGEQTTPPSKPEEIETKESVQKELKLAQEKMKEALCNQVESIQKGISASVDKILSEVKRMQDGCERSSRVQSLKSDLHALDNKIDGVFNDIFNQYVALLESHEALEKEDTRKNFNEIEKSRIDSMLVMLFMKVKEDVSSTVYTSQGGSYDNRDKTFLKKRDPPKFKGDPVDFVDFMRKWKSQVSIENLPAESELDRLRENIPVQAAKALYGETDMSKAWRVLENLYGDSDLIANILKNQLKTIKSKGRFSPDDPWSDFAIDAVTFGDLPAANCLEIGRNKTADAGESIDAAAAAKLKDDCYVDD